MRDFENDEELVAELSRMTGSACVTLLPRSQARPEENVRGEAFRVQVRLMEPDHHATTHSSTPDALLPAMRR